MDRQKLNGQKFRLGIIALCTALVMAAVPTAALADQPAAEEGGIGVAAAFGSLLYAPTKVAYAVGGTVVGGLAWLFSAGDNDVAIPIWNRAVRGDYVLTPEHVRGERSIQFIGRDDQPAVATGPPPTDDPAW